MPAGVPPRSRLLTVNAVMLLLAIIIASLGAWQLQMPVLRLSRAAREFRLGHRPLTLRAAGPSEVRSLIDDFNDMVRALSDAEQERSVMLAGVAHDLRAPLTRIQIRAVLVHDDRLRDDFMHDAQSLSQIVTQFLDFARDIEDNPTQPRVSVDGFCCTHYVDDSEDQLFHLDLRAGDEFKLPAIELDRLLSNLVENAYSYGAPPVHISTSSTSGQHHLSVRDHGPGIPEEQFARALQPFVRIDPARGGDAHCGLGLAIVRRLTRRCGGDLSLCNAPDGGLVVTLVFPH